MSNITEAVNSTVSNIDTSSATSAALDYASSSAVNLLGLLTSLGSMIVPSNPKMGAIILVGVVAYFMWDRIRDTNWMYVVIGIVLYVWFIGGV